MPGVLLVEAMAQTAAVLVIAGLGAAARGQSVYFMGIEERPVPPAGATGRSASGSRSRSCATSWAYGSSAVVPWWTAALR